MPKNKFEKPVSSLGEPSVSPTQRTLRSKSKPDEATNLIPKKKKIKQCLPEGSTEPIILDEQPPEKRKRGRPRKIRPTEEMPILFSVENGSKNEKKEEEEKNEIKPCKVTLNQQQVAEYIKSTGRTFEDFMERYQNDNSEVEEPVVINQRTTFLKRGKSAAKLKEERAKKVAATEILQTGVTLPENIQENTPLVVAPPPMKLTDEPPTVTTQFIEQEEKESPDIVKPPKELQTDESSQPPSAQVIPPTNLQANKSPVVAAFPNKLVEEPPFVATLSKEPEAEKSPAVVTTPKKLHSKESPASKMPPKDLNASTEPVVPTPPKELEPEVATTSSKEPKAKKTPPVVTPSKKLTPLKKLQSKESPKNLKASTEAAVPTPSKELEPQVATTSSKEPEAKNSNDALPTELISKESLASVVPRKDIQREESPVTAALPEKQLENVPFEDVTVPRETRAKRSPKKPSKADEQVPNKSVSNLKCNHCQTEARSVRSLAIHKKFCLNRPKIEKISIRTLRERALLAAAASQKRKKSKKKRKNKNKNKHSQYALSPAEVHETVVETVNIKAEPLDYEDDCDDTTFHESGCQTEGTWMPGPPTKFYCVPCKENYLFSHALKQHVLDVHLEAMDSTHTSLGGAKKLGLTMVKFTAGVASYFQCPYCWTLRENLEKAVEHFRLRHTDKLGQAIVCQKVPVKVMKSVPLAELPYQQFFCDYCKQSFSTFHLLKYHLDIAHNVRECLLCICFFKGKHGDNAICLRCSCPQVQAINYTYHRAFLPLANEDITKLKNDISIIEAKGTNETGQFEQPPVILSVCSLTEQENFDYDGKPDPNLEARKPESSNTEKFEIFISKSVLQPKKSVIDLGNFKANPALKEVEPPPVPPVKHIEAERMAQECVIIDTDSLGKVPDLIVQEPGVEDVESESEIRGSEFVIMDSDLENHELEPETPKSKLDRGDSESDFIVSDSECREPEKPNTPEMDDGEEPEILESADEPEMDLMWHRKADKTTTLAKEIELMPNLQVSEPSAITESEFNQLQDESPSNLHSLKENLSILKSATPAEEDKQSSDDDDDYGVEALESLLQKLKPNKQKEPSPPPITDYKITLTEISQEFSRSILKRNLPNQEQPSTSTPPKQRRKPCPASKKIGLNLVSLPQKTTVRPVALVNDKSIEDKVSKFRVNLTSDEVAEGEAATSTGLHLNKYRYKHLTHPNRYIPCLYCLEVSDNYLDMTYHLLLKHSYCLVCRDTFKDSLGHFTQHDRLRFYKCSYFGCNQTFRAAEHCVTHEEFIHDYESSGFEEKDKVHGYYVCREKGLFHCFYCAEFFSDQSLLDQHLVYEHNVCVCVECHNFFRNGCKCMICALK